MRTNALASAQPNNKIIDMINRIRTLLQPEAIKITVKDPVAVPRAATPSGGIYELRSRVTLAVHPHELVVIPTGLHVHMPEDVFAGLYLRPVIGAQKIIMANGVSIIGPDCRGEVKGMIINMGQVPYVIRKGDRLFLLAFHKKATTSSMKVVCRMAKSSCTVTKDT